jgi:ADP-ribose pyrophosphatase
MERWPKIRDDIETTIGWRKLVTKTFEQPDGQPAEYVTKDAIGKVACAIIALTANNEVVVAEQFRPGPEEILLELPGGGAEDQESSQEVAVRELKEETGYVPNSVEYLGKVYKDAYTNTTWHFFLGRDCWDSGEQQLDEGEFVNVRLISIEELFDNARSARMTDTEAVFLAYETLKEIQRGNKPQ